MTLMEWAETRPKIPQIVAVAALMNSGKWYTLQGLRDSCYIVFEVGISEAGVSARLRDLRKPAYGKHVIDRRPTNRKGIFEYRMSA